MVKQRNAALTDRRFKFTAKQSMCNYRNINIISIRVQGMSAVMNTEVLYLFNKMQKGTVKH